MKFTSGIILKCAHEWHKDIQNVVLPCPLSGSGMFSPPLKGAPCPSGGHLASLLPPAGPLTTTHPLSVAMGLPVLDISHKQSHNSVAFCLWVFPLSIKSLSSAQGEDSFKGHGDHGWQRLGWSCLVPGRVEPLIALHPVACSRETSHHPLGELLLTH